MQLRAVLLALLFATTACTLDHAASLRPEADGPGELEAGGPELGDDVQSWHDAGRPAALDTGRMPWRDASVALSDASLPRPGDAGRPADASPGGPNDAGPTDARAPMATPPDASVPVDPPVPARYAVRVNVRGLRGPVGSGLTLTLAGVALSVRDNGSFSFAATLSTGSSFAVALSKQPSAPAHVCTLQNGVGRVAGRDPTVEVVCEPLGGLRISEVGSCYHVDSACWFELYNAGSSAEELSRYHVRSPAALGTAPYSRLTEHRFRLPGLLLEPGRYALVAAASSGALPDGQGVVHVRDGQLLPWWNGDGFLELLSGDQTVDFVRFGDNAVEPLTPGNFVATTPATLATGPVGYGRALARDLTQSDSNAALDFVAREFATPMGPNDLSSDLDADGDGLPDQAEQPGGHLAGLDLYAMGARSGVRDLFVEIDRMNSRDPAVTPRREALDKLVAVFAKHGIALHFDVGNLFVPSFDPQSYNLGGGNVVPFAPGIGLRSSSEGVADLYDYKAAYMAPQRRPVFYYMMFGYSQQADGSNGASGVGELPGNDSLITLGGYGFSAATQRGRNLLANYQASTMMHEFGHNLSLRHGGDEQLNNKPNYLSVMNYLYSSLGLPSIGNREGDRYDLVSSCSLSFMSQLTNSPLQSPAEYDIDFSSGESADLDEQQVRESEGLGRLQSVAVDFDCSGSIEDGYGADLNFDGRLQTLHDHDDWQSLQLVFRRHVAANDSGPTLWLVHSVAADVTVDDRQPNSPEPCPPALRLE